jgi:NADH-quinone oxidoreductase subunit G
MLKQNGEWQVVDWQTALNYVVHGVRDIVAKHGPDALAALVSPHSTLEEMALTAQIVRGLGSENVDFRLRQADVGGDAARKGAPWLGMPIAEVGALDRILIVGSFLRKDHPLLSARIRGAVKKGARLSVVHAVDENLLMPVAAKAIVPPSQMIAVLADIAAALADAKGAARPAGTESLQPGESAKRIAASLASGQNVAVFFGNFAQQHADASKLEAWAQAIATLAGARFGILGAAANSAGGYLAGALPQNGGNAAELVSNPRQVYLLVNAEPELDCANPAQAMHALGEAQMVVALSPYRHRASEYADVLLPIAPFTETSGTFVNCEGRAQSFNGVVPPFAETRPAWKVLRVLGNLLGLEGFEFTTSEQVRDAVLGTSESRAARFDNAIDLAPESQAGSSSGAVERIADVPIYHADPLVRRASSLQQTADGRRQKATMNAATLASLQLVEGEFARFRQEGGEAMLTVEVDASVPDRCVRIPAGLPTTAALGAMSGAVTAERMP